VEPRFVHLRTRTAYSLLEGALRIKGLAGLCEAQGMPAVAVTDTSNLFGALEVSEALAGKGIQPIIGLTIALETGISAEAGFQAGAPRRRKMPQIALLAKDEAGYANLMQLSSLAYFRDAGAALPFVTLADLKLHAQGLICLSGGGEGPINQFLVDGQKPLAAQVLARLSELFPQHLYIELHRHGLKEEALAEPLLVEFAYAHALPLVATNDVYFPARDDFEAHDALLCIAEGSYVIEDKRRRLTPEHYFKSQDEMAALFADVPEAIANTVEIARRCAFRPRGKAPILPRFANDIDGEALELARQAREGLKNRLASHPPYADEKVYWERLEYEISVITGMKFPGYFLIVADFIKWAKAQGIPVGPGRGSGAGSVVAWALTITDLDPLRFGLLFERFLNPERVSMPDFDIDFCQDRRDEVIRYVQQKYGADRVAQIITFGTLQARAALRDVGRVLGVPYKQVDRLCKLVPANPANPVTLAQALESEPKLQEERDRDEQVARMLKISLRLEGLYRHASTHAAGVVIGDRPLGELVPLYRDPRSDMPVTQFSMKWAEHAGLVKFDFLGLKTLTVLDVACQLIREDGVPFDLDAIPLDDPQTYALLGRGDGTGVFQLESSGMRDTLKKMKPDKIEDIIALVALYRPGPMDNIPLYIDVKQSHQSADYLHPLLEPILKETYGVIIYQEQVMQIAQVLSGYSLGEADLLRRAMGKKIKAEMDKQKSRFVEGAVERGVVRERAAFIFELVEKFAGYGFNKSHAAAYALIAYQTAYLKANYPVAFMAATMTLDIHNTDKLNVFRQDVLRLGIDLLPPDVNRSRATFSLEGGKIRFALGALKNVGVQAMEALVAERDRNGPYRDLFDFAQRVEPQIINRRALESLAKAGAFDAMNPNRAQVLGAVDLMLAQANLAAQERASNQVSLFGGGSEEIARPVIPQVSPWTPLERLSHEFDALGFYLSGHPLDDYRAALSRMRISSYAEIAAAPGLQSRVKLAGVVVRRQERRSKSGNKFAFVEFSDATGRFEAMVWSDMLATSRDLLEAGQTVVVTADAEREGDDLRLKLQTVVHIDEVVRTASGGLRIVVDRPEVAEMLPGRLPGPGKGQLTLVVVNDGDRREVEIAVPGRFAATPRAITALRAVPGVVAVEEI